MNASCDSNVSEKLFKTDDGIEIQCLRVGGRNTYYGTFHRQHFDGCGATVYMTEAKETAEDAVFRAREIRRGANANALRS